ncbi:hypothetical protein ACA910_022334 [Epithemia clementina (nom. ined.)]
MIPLCTALDTLELAAMDLSNRGSYDDDEDDDPSRLSRPLRALLESPTCQVTVLKFCHCTLHLDTWEELMHGIRTYAKLTTLQIRDCATTGDSSLSKEALELLGAVALSPQIPNGLSSSWLKSLEISRVPPGPQVPSLRQGEPWSHPLTKHCLPVLTSLLGQLVSLERLKISGQNQLFLMEDAEYDSSNNDENMNLMKFRFFADTVINHVSLKAADLSFCRIDYLRGKIMFEMLENNTATTLHYLNLQSNDFSGKLGLSYLPALKVIRKLYLPGCHNASTTGQRELFSIAVGYTNTTIWDCRCGRGRDLRSDKVRSIMRRNRMIYHARSILAIQRELWPLIFAMIPEKSDPTALHVAILGAQSGLTAVGREDQEWIKQGAMAEQEQRELAVSFLDDGWTGV